jgi:hypothetical protein
VVFDRPYPDAPVSNLYYQGRLEDNMAFEKPHGRITAAIEIPVFSFERRAPIG